VKENYIKLSKLAKDLGVTKQTLWNWKYRGDLEFVKVGSLNCVTKEVYNNLLGIENKDKERVVIYCRVSSTENKTNLETQKQRLISYCNAKGYSVSDVVTEFGSGVNDQRPKLQKLLREQNFTRLVVEHKDRLTRVGFEYIETLLSFNGISVEVINNTDSDQEDLIQDFISIITSYCARIYGKRRSKRKTEQLIKEMQNGDC
jgi:predicted site-specific integrase-resolvase